MDDLRKSVKPLYEELKGYFAVIPDKEVIYDEVATQLSCQLNGTIDELNVITETSYEKFKSQTRNIDWNGSRRIVLSTRDYRSKLSGLISKLRGEYAFDGQQK